MSEANTTPVCCNISTQTAPECTVTPWHCGKCSVSQVWTCLSLYLSSNHMHGIKDVIVPKGLVLIFQADAKHHFYPFQLSRPYILWVNLFLFQISHWALCEWMAEPGFGSPTPNTARKGFKPQNNKSTTERKWWIRERKTWRWLDEENGTKGKMLQQRKPSVCNIFPKKKKRLKGSCWGYLGLSWKLHYPVIGREQTRTWDREIPLYILSSHLFLC